MKKQTIAMAILSFTAALLLTVSLLPPAAADFSVKDNNYQLLTVTGQTGSSTVYVIDVRSGRLAVFAPDIRNPGRYQVAKIQDVSDFFQPAR